MKKQLLAALAALPLALWLPQQAQAAGCSNCGGGGCGYPCCFSWKKFLFHCCGYGPFDCCNPCCYVPPGGPCPCVLACKKGCATWVPACKSPCGPCGGGCHSCCKQPCCQQPCCCDPCVKQCGCKSCCKSCCKGCCKPCCGLCCWPCRGYAYVGPWYMYWPLEAHFNAPAPTGYPYWPSAMAPLGYYPGGGYPSYWYGY